MIDIAEQLKTLDIDMIFANSDKIGKDNAMVQYRAKLLHNFLNLFDIIEFKVGEVNGKFLRNKSGKLIVAGIIFKNEGSTQKIEDIRNLVTYILNLYDKKDDDWTDTDEYRISSGAWRGRIIFQDGALCFVLNDNGNVSFEFTSLDKLINRLSN